jgi:hypothetical protein
MENKTLSFYYLKKKIQQDFSVISCLQDEIYDYYLNTNLEKKRKVKLQGQQFYIVDAGSSISKGKEDRSISNVCAFRVIAKAMAGLFNALYGNVNKKTEDNLVLYYINCILKYNECENYHHLKNAYEPGNPADREMFYMLAPRIGDVAITIYSSWDGGIGTKEKVQRVNHVGNKFNINIYLKSKSGRPGHFQLLVPIKRRIILSNSVSSSNELYKSLCNSVIDMKSVDAIFKTLKKCPPEYSYMIYYQYMSIFRLMVSEGTENNFSQSNKLIEKYMDNSAKRTKQENKLTSDFIKSLGISASEQAKLFAQYQ